MGNPSARRMTTKRMDAFGISNNGKTCVVSWVRNQATTPYATAARYTFRRFSSAKNFLGFTSFFREERSESYQRLPWLTREINFARNILIVALGGAHGVDGSLLL